MRFLKLAIVSVVLLCIMLLAISLVLPSTVLVRRSIDINAPVDTIFKKISDLNQWKVWIVNRDSLPVNVTTSNGHQNLTMGNTTVNVTAVSKDQVETTWRVNKGQAMPCYINILPNKNTPITTLQWQFEQHVNWYPWEKFSAMLSDKVLGPFVEQNLHKIKESCEAATP